MRQPERKIQTGANLVLCNRYGLPIVEFKMVRRFATANPSGGGQGARREHRNAGAGPSRVCGTQPSGPQFRKISASLSRPAPNAFGAALRSLLEIPQAFLGDWQAI